MAWATWMIGATALVVAGCCGGGPTHSCDFTPIESGSDGGTDAPMMCGTKVCAASQVCCVTKVPLNADCIEPARFETMGCEKMPLPCFKPSDCPGGLACCLVLNPDLTGAVSCLPDALCVAGEMSFVACAADTDCPPVRPACTLLAPTSEGDFKVCR